MRNEDGAKAGAKIVNYTTIIPPLLLVYQTNLTSNCREFQVIAAVNT